MNARHWLLGALRSRWFPSVAVLAVAAVAFGLREQRASTVATAQPTSPGPAPPNRPIHPLSAGPQGYIWGTQLLRVVTERLGWDLSGDQVSGVMLRVGLSAEIGHLVGGEK